VIHPGDLGAQNMKFEANINSNAGHRGTIVFEAFCNGKLSGKTRRTVWLRSCVFFMFLLLVSQTCIAENVTYYVTNAQGTVVAQMDTNANVTYTATYRPYGRQQQGVPQAGPGYTGHVNDPGTGLVYMQARYYDPSIGRFLSVDPVTPAAANLYNFNRYDYAIDNPIINVDPDGRKVQFILAPNTSFYEVAKMAVYLSGSSTAVHEFSQILNSKITYTLDFNRNGTDSYDYKTKTVVINPRSGLVIKSSGKVENPSIGAIHEVSHAAENDRVGNKVFNENRQPPMVTLPNGMKAVVISYPPIGPNLLYS